jgi:hypothetical protein
MLAYYPLALGLKQPVPPFPHPPNVHGMWPRTLTATGVAQCKKELTSP